MNTHSKTEDYLLSLVQKRSAMIREIEQYAKDNHVPIMEPTGMQLLLQFLEVQKPTKVLEVGTAIGYSAIRMATSVPNSTIYSIERDEARLTIARENIEKFELEERIKLMKGDALEMTLEIAPYGPFDVLFIDAAKGQYERFFTLYEPYVTNGGLIISDNVLFKGMVAGEVDIPTKNTNGMVKKLRDFNEKRMKDRRFSTMIYPVGDGVMVSKKKTMEEIGD